MAAGAAVGGFVFLFIAQLQLDADTCGSFAERECTPEELRLDFDAALTLAGLALAIGTVVFGATCALTARKRSWSYTLVTFAGAAALGLALEILDIPNR
jgi:hypothetical protein